MALCVPSLRRGVSIGFNLDRKETLLRIKANAAIRTRQGLPGLHFSNVDRSGTAGLTF
jgi:hypothetical protein